jgi:hypothetical protein
LIGWLTRVGNNEWQAMDEQYSESLNQTSMQQKKDNAADRIV